MSDYKVKAWSWCADYCKKNHWNPHDSYFWDKAMLEYRRENNIFEVGDKVVLTGYMKDDSNDILIVNSIGKYDFSFVGRDDLHINTIHSFSVVVRHATTEEIQAGRRL